MPPTMVGGPLGLTARSKRRAAPRRPYILAHRWDKEDEHRIGLGLCIKEKEGRAGEVGATLTSCGEAIVRDAYLPPNP